MSSPVRASMQDIIARVRRSIGDTSGPSEFFTDDLVQDQLDAHRFTVRYAPLQPGPTLTTGGLYDYLDYYARVGNWESDCQLTWVDFSVITPASSELIAGHWTLSNPPGNPNGVYPPVRITGKYYDVYAASADLLELWAAQLVSTAYDFTSDGQTFHRSQIVQGKLGLVQQYRRKAMAVSRPVRRTDLAAGHSGFGLDAGGPGEHVGVASDGQ